MQLHTRLTEYIGQPIAILCARYWYRGILKEVGEDHVLLTNPRAVEVTGSASQDHPEREDVIPSDLMVRLDFVEIVCQPSWVYFEMSESDRKKKEEELKSGKKPEPAKTARR